MVRGSRLQWFYRPENEPAVISWTGALLFLAFLVEWIAFYGTRVEPLLTWNFLLSFLLAVGFSAGIVYAGYRIEASDLPDDRYPRIFRWFLGGLAVFFAINAPMMVVWHPGSIQGVLGWARISLALGGMGGVLFGSVEARAIQRELVAERAAVRADEAESQRKWFDYLNALLRHEVLNTVQVITAYTSAHLTDEDLEDDLRNDLETIHERAQDMADVIQDVQTLVEATRNDGDLAVVDLADVVTAELDALRDTWNAVEISTSIPDDAYVIADDLLSRVFANLLTNAVQHNDSEVPRVDVTAEVDSDTVSVSIADNGPGVPDSERETLFERNDGRGGAHGLGLYLVRILVERYGGTVRLSETGADGSVFTVELPRAADETADSVTSPSDTSPSDRALRVEDATEGRYNTDGR